MTPHPWEHDARIVDRVVDVLVSPARHAPAMIGVAYLLAVVGLGLTLVTGADGETFLSLAGLCCMVVSFLVLFYTSLTILDGGE